MLDLLQKLRGTAKHLEAFLSKSKDEGKHLGILFYHTHPNYGQSHLYIGEDETVEPEEDILGKQVIEDVIDYEGWLDSTTWWEGESSDGKVELVRLSGERIQIGDNAQFNAIWAEDIETQIREACLSMDASLIPTRVVVYAESGEYRADWRTKTGPNKARMDNPH
jgi:hypothetical protein